MTKDIRNLGKAEICPGIKVVGREKASIYGKEVMLSYQSTPDTIIFTWMNTFCHEDKYTME